MRLTIKLPKGITRDVWPLDRQDTCNLAIIIGSIVVWLMLKVW